VFITTSVYVSGWPTPTDSGISYSTVTAGACFDPRADVVGTLGTVAADGGTGATSGAGPSFKLGGFSRSKPGEAVGGAVGMLTRSAVTAGGFGSGAESGKPGSGCGGVTGSLFPVGIVSPIEGDGVGGANRGTSLFGWSASEAPAGRTPSPVGNSFGFGAAGGAVFVPRGACRVVDGAGAVLPLGGCCG
jgi:hypothetical protein